MKESNDEMRMSENFYADLFAHLFCITLQFCLNLCCETRTMIRQLSLYFAVYIHTHSTEECEKLSVYEGEKNYSNSMKFTR